ncbi:MAG TPA: zinc ribbon domain-containing protein [Gemmatimonadaceae bacterium]|nr:zinc ribbon domain-containing protein [Gemmatimonadaceae bacterium]
MPTYEYRCPKGHDFEKFYRSISGAPAVVACPTCGKTAERQMSAGAGLVFKGSGFYITDYGKDGKKAENAAAAAKKTASESAATESSPKEAAVAKAEPTSSSKSESGGDKKSPPPAKAESKPAPSKTKSSE